MLSWFNGLQQGVRNTNNPGVLFGEYRKGGSDTIQSQPKFKPEPWSTKALTQSINTEKLLEKSVQESALSSQIILSEAKGQQNLLIRPGDIKAKQGLSAKHSRIIAVPGESAIILGRPRDIFDDRTPPCPPDSGSGVNQTTSNPSTNT